MNKKLSIAIIIILTALFVLFAAYINANSYEEDHSGENIKFNVSSGANPINDTIKQIKTLPYYEGHDKDTMEWMESLGDMCVFYGNDSIVVMKSSDAEKIPPEPGITDVDIYTIFTADVIENHSLVKNQQTVYLVENVTFINREVVGNGLA